MSNIEFNLFYNDNGIKLEAIIDKLIEQKKEIVTMGIKNGSITRYNKDEYYLSTDIKSNEVDKK